MRPYRKVIGINTQTGEKKEWDGIYEFAKEVNTCSANARQALGRNGLCCGWRLYDTPDRLRERIAELEAQIEVLEG